MSKDLENFYEYWNKKINSGEVSPLSRSESRVLEIYDDYLDDEKTKKILKKMTLKKQLKDCSDKFDQLTDMYNDLQFAIRFVISLVQDVTEGRMTVDELRKYKEQAEKKEVVQ